MERRDFIQAMGLVAGATAARLALGGTALGTGINAAPGFAEAATGEIARLTKLPFGSAPWA